MPASYRVVHHGFVRGLFLALDGEERVVSNLGRCISSTVCILQGREAFLSRVLFQLLELVAFDQVVDSSLSKEVRFHFLGCAGLAVGRPLVHPVNSIYPFLSSGGLELPLQLFLCALLLDFIDALLRPLALGQSLLLFIVNSCLVTPKRWVERLFQVEIAASHICGLR